MDRQQLKEWESHLNREQDHWNGAKADLERKVKRLEALAETLEEKVKAKQAAFEHLTAENERLGEQLTNLAEKVGKFQRDIAEREQQQETLEATLGDLDALVRSKQASIDANLVEYETERRKELTDRLGAAQQQLAEAESALSELNTQVAAKRGELDGLREALVAERGEREKAEAEGGDRLEALRGQESDLQARIEALEPEVAKLLHERDAAVSAATLAQQEHERFVKYEKIAWASLNTKDKELQDRQAELDVEERHLTARRSFLPKL